MKKIISKTLVATGILFAIAAFFLFLFAPAIVLKSTYFWQTTEDARFFSGLNLIYGAKALNGGLEITFEEGATNIYHFPDNSLLKQISEVAGNLNGKISYFSVDVLANRQIESMPIVLIVFGVVVCGVASLLDNKKEGLTLRILGVLLFLSAGMFIFYALEFCNPIVQTPLSPEFIISFKESYNLGWGAIIGGIFSIIAGIIFAADFAIQIIDFKRKKHI